MRTLRTLFVWVALVGAAIALYTVTTPAGEVGSVERFAADVRTLAGEVSWADASHLELRHERGRTIVAKAQIVTLETA